MMNGQMDQSRSNEDQLTTRAKSIPLPGNDFYLLGLEKVWPVATDLNL